MKRKIVSILLCIAVCMTMMPTVGYAANVGWKVAGVEVTGTGTVTGNGITGTVTYDATSNTLTLKNATIKPTNGAGILCGGDDKPVIELQGENVIEASGNGISIFDSNVSNLTIKSEDGGSLKVKGTLGINCGNLSNSVALTLSNVKVEATGTNGHGISTKGNITLKNAVVTATGIGQEDYQNNYCGIKSDDQLTLEKSSISAKRGNGSSNNIEATGGIFAKGAEITGEYNSDTENVFTSDKTKKLWSNNEITLRNNFKEYGLWVGGVQVTEKNKGNVLGDNKVSYDASSNTLTLNNATITGSHTDGDKSAAVMAVRVDSGKSPDINIKLIGKNTITNTTSTNENTTSYGIYTLENISVTNGSATESAGTVTIKSNDDAVYSWEETTISNVTVTATSTNGNGIYSSNNITLTNVTVTATSTNGNGIDSFNNITLTNANVMAKGANGIQSGYDITVEPNSTVRAEGTTGYGIAAGNNITFKNSDIEAKGNNGNAIVSKDGEITCTAEMSPMKNGKNFDSEDGFNHIIRAISAGDWVSLKRTTHTLYYNTKDGKMYTSYDETSGFSNEWDRGGIKGKDDTLTLKDLYFVTTADKALVIPGMTKKDTITINCEGKNTIRAGYDGSTGTCGIQTNANLVINGELTMVSSNINVKGDIQLVDADVVVSKAITDGKLILENAILETMGYSGEGTYSIETKEGIYYFNNLYGTKEGEADTSCATLPDSNIVSKLGNSFFTLHAEAFADFHANEGEWKDRTGTAYTLERNRSEEKQEGKRWIALPDAPTRDGYNFVGWFTAAEGGTQITGDKVQYNREETATVLQTTYDRSGYKTDASNTYYAHWEEVPQHDHSYPDTWTAVRPGSTHIHKCQYPGCNVEKSESCVSDGKATCQEFAKCTVCGGDCDTKADHDFTAETVGNDYLKSAATCKTKAVYYKSCAVCGLSSQGTTGEATYESGEPTNHSFGDWTITKQPTATEKGSKERVCSACQYKETAEIPATGGSTSGGGSSRPSGSDVVTVTDDKTGASEEGKTTTTKTTVKDTKTETTKNEQGQTVSKTTATVSKETADKLADQAVASKSDKVEITVKANTNTELDIPKSALEKIAKNTDADLVIKTDNTQVVLDNKTLETITKETAGGTVRIVVDGNTSLTEKQKPAKDVLGNNGYLFELKAYIGSKLIHDFKGGKAQITLPMPENLKDKDIVVVYIDDNGICTLLNHTLETVGADKYIKFTTTHFSSFAVVEKAKAEQLIKEPNLASVKKLVKNAKIKVTTAKTGKKSVKVTVTPKNSKTLISDIRAMGYTVKYQFYRSTKKSSGYKLLKTKATNSYTNTKGTKGRKYYYKARVLVYDGKTLIAKTALKQASYGVRTWTK